ncbi:unnamed protein product [Hermetia illucens]|uniref:Kelch-like protein diablo n=1 Tax=Hermetia illucens TaxID=343691 RepID=A0A7R8UR61_HERIL|nr:kelch-like protein 12 isoform X2 [Hermetia illucens]CAD7085503.1 unnamed protein product [Hermetia illucens]
MSDEIEISDQDHFSHYFAIIDEYRKIGRFCDVTICVEGGEITAHKTVLSSSSPYFDALFGENFRERKYERIELHHDTNFEIMSKIIDYIYTGKIRISLNDASILLKNFDYLQMRDATLKCVEYLLQNVNHDNCIQLFILAGELMGNGVLQNAAITYIGNYLTEISSSAKFKTLDRTKLESIVAEIEQSKADAIFTAIMNWIKYDIPNRSEDVEALLKYVSIKHLSLQNIRNNILADDFLNSNPSGCKWLVSSFLRNSSSFILGRKNSLLYISSLGVDSMNYEFDVHSRILVKQTARPFLFRCATMKLNDLIYAVGGEKDNQVADFGLTYDMRHKSWAPFSCPLNRTSCGVCTLDDKLYAICGLNANGRKLFSCLSYDAELDRWTNLQDMKNARRYPGAATYYSSIYALGGYNGNASGTVVERYDPREGVWQDIVKVKSKGCCSAAFLSNSIYCLEYDTEELISFDPRSLKFNVVKERAGLYITALDGYLYSVHKDGISQYDPHLSVWEEILCHPLADSPVITG